MKGLVSKPKAGARPKAPRRSPTLKAKLPLKKEDKKPVIKRESSSQNVSSSSRPTTGVVTINRAPVLTLWMSICLEKLGYSEEAALCAAQIITGLAARAKGKALGIIRTSDASDASATTVKKKPSAKAESEIVVSIAGFVLPLDETPDGFKTPTGGSAANPDRVKAYLSRAFKETLDDVRSEMSRAAATYSRSDLKTEAMHLYERFRPAWKGWGVPGQLYIRDIRAVRR